MDSFEKYLIETNSEFALFGPKCLENPHDPLPWLVAADWCAEHGETQVENYLRSVAILVAESIEGIDQAFNMVEMDNVPSGRRDYAEFAGNQIPWFAQWLIKRPDLIPCMTAGILDEEELSNNLPSGSGIDATWEIEARERDFVCGNAYHAMDEGGGYAGWVHFEVFIPYRRPLDFHVEVNQGDIANLEARDVFVGDLDDYLHSTINQSLRSYLSK